MRQALNQAGTLPTASSIQLSGSGTATTVNSSIKETAGSPFGAPLANASHVLVTASWKVCCCQPVRPWLASCTTTVA